MQNFNDIRNCANANLAHNGANSDITSLTALSTPIPVNEGGTGSATAAGARTNLGLGAAAVENLANNITDDGAGNLVVVIPPQIFVAGAVRNLAMYLAAASGTATFTADSVNVGTALNGTGYVLPSYSKGLDVSTVGAGGMDNGAAPVSGYLCIYAIYKVSPATTSILAQTETGVCTTIYSGGHMPAGYTASGLIAVWPTSAGSLLVAGQLRDRLVWIVPVAIFTNGTDAAYTSKSLTTAVPQSAIAIYGHLKAYNTAPGVVITYMATDAGGIGEVQVQSEDASAGANPTGDAPFANVPVHTVQAIFYKTSNHAALVVSGYSF